MISSLQTCVAGQIRAQENTNGYETGELHLPTRPGLSLIILVEITHVSCSLT